MISLQSAESRKLIADYINDDNNKMRVDVNESIFEILEGSLTPALEEKLRKDLGNESAERALTRMAPINYYKKVIDKLTSIYNQGVVRTVENGTDSDEELLSWYENVLMMNPKMDANNSALNAYKYALLHMTLTNLDDPSKSKPFIRTIPNHEFLVMSTSKVDPTSADVIIVMMGKREIEGRDNRKKDQEHIFYVYTDEEFIIMNERGDILTDLMAEYDLEGNNPYGTIPFVYANMSQNLAMPLLQVDDMEMSVLIPLLMTDLNTAVKWQAFSMYVAIDMEAQNIKIAPDSILSLKSDPTGGDKPSFETVKASVDISEVLNLAASEISLWLSSKGIRPGSIGKLGADSFASGISKMIDESDTYESRTKQIEIYKAFEAVFWDKILKVMHPIWVSQGLVENRTIFSPSAKVLTTFKVPQPLKSRGELLDDIKKAIDLGLESRAGALKILYPDWDEQAIEEKLESIDSEARQIVEQRMEGLGIGGDNQD